MKTVCDVAIILVGLDSRAYVEQCLDSLRKTQWDGITYDTIYVDNASRDGSVAAIQGKFPEVTVIANPTNAGFCRACNQASSQSSSRYIFYLNDDTIVFPDTIPRLVRFLDQTPDATAVGCRLLYPDMSEQWSGRRFPTWKNAIFGRRSLMGKWFPNAAPIRQYLYKDAMERGEAFVVDWIPGSCTLARRSAVEVIGGLPEDLHYWSDAVFCDRLTRAVPGKLYVLPASRLIHFEGHGSGKKTYKLANRLILDFHRGAYTFYCEHFQLGPLHPARWFAAVGLGFRARLLMLVNWVRNVTKTPAA
jgi:N-acetylglucosaminyl-diphospho-decaprenol L-rhamnosyltransferase